MAAKLPRELLILTSEHAHQWVLSDAQFWKSRKGLLRSMVRVNKHWVRGNATWPSYDIESSFGGSMQPSTASYTVS